jgi:cytochrome P450
VFTRNSVQKEKKLRKLILPAGVQIAILAIHAHHGKELGCDDASEFKPDRFSEGVSKATKCQFSFIPFGWGPRIYIRQNFAMIEAKMAVSMILQSLEPSPFYTHAPSAVLSVHPQYVYGAHIILRKL